MQQGNGTAMSRGDWGTAMNQTISQVSYVNIAAEATVSITDNVMNIHVEVYYTGDSPEATNFINVALIESNIEGPQTGGSTYNPDFVLPNGNYSHQHMLRDLITGQWGEEITTTTAGSFIDLNYTYTVPGQFTEVPVNVANLDLVVFITETTQEIESACTTKPVVTGLVNTYDASVAGVIAPETVCGNEVAFSVMIKNNGNELLTSLEIDYSVNGGDIATYSWTGELLSLVSESVELPPVVFSPMESNEVNITVYLPNGEDDEDESNNDGTTTFMPPVSATQTIYLELMTDEYGTETSWELTTNDGEVLFSGSGYGNNTLINETFEIEVGDCFAFVIHDTYGDGICCDYGDGYYVVTDSDDTEIFSGGDFGFDETTEFNSVLSTGISIGQAENIQVYPNPTNGQLFLKGTENAEIKIFNTLGNEVASYENFTGTVIDMSNFRNGIYFISIAFDDSTVVNKKINLIK